MSTQTELSDDRMRRLLARIEEHRFMVRHEIKSMLYNFEVEMGMVPPSTSIYSKVRSKPLTHCGFVGMP